jgi:hypothetical protein
MLAARRCAAGKSAHFTRKSRRGEANCLGWIEATLLFRATTEIEPDAAATTDLGVETSLARATAKRATSNETTRLADVEAILATRVVHPNAVRIKT